jgi:hypothetical protein
MRVVKLPASCELLRRCEVDLKFAGCRQPAQSAGTVTMVAVMRSTKAAHPRSGRRVMGRVWSRTAGSHHLAGLCETRRKSRRILNGSNGIVCNTPHFQVAFSAKVWGNRRSVPSVDTPVASISGT